MWDSKYWLECLRNATAFSYYTATQVSSLKPREWADPRDRWVSVRSSMIYHRVTPFGWVCLLESVGCLIIWLLDFLFSELRLWNRARLDYRFRARKRPKAQADKEAQRRIKLIDGASPSVITQLWREHIHRLLLWGVWEVWSLDQ